MKVPQKELADRMERFRAEMDVADPGWEACVIFSKVNLYYFTGTRQDGMLVILRDGEPILWVRRSYERALDESLFGDIRPMNSYRDAAGQYKSFPGRVYMETEVVPLALAQRFQKYFPYERVLPVDSYIAKVRSVKSAYELEMMRKSGEIHRRVMEDIVPQLLREGISEAEFSAELYAAMVREGHHGITRFAMFDTEMPFGQVGFGVNSLYPTYFNGPGGNLGLSPAVPLLGSRERKLRKGDLVFVDVGCGYAGYHTDKTNIYVFGAELPAQAAEAHRRCVEVQNEAASMLKPGVTPAEIYGEILGELDERFLENFMGFGNRRVKFLGHGIGLQTDETPVIAKGFDEPLREGMLFAVEPKKGIEGVGMVGIENTFLVTKDGGVSITGSRFEPIRVQ